MTEQERREAEMRSIMRLAGLAEPKKEAKKTTKKQTKGEKK